MYIEIFNTWLLHCYSIKKLKISKIVDANPSVICPVLNTLAFETFKSIKIPLQATSAKVSLNKRSIVIFIPPQF